MHSVHTKYYSYLISITEIKLEHFGYSKVKKIGFCFALLYFFNKKF